MVVDIVIKSFNRPYYLEKCIRSVYQYVAGDFKIKILDDGTPQKYLTKIYELFPEVVISKSPYYTQKSAALTAHIAGTEKYKVSLFPSKFWVEEIQKCSDIFLLLEDDIWLTSPLNVSEVSSLMVNANVATIKLSWLGNTGIIAGEKVALGKGIEQIKPISLTKLPLTFLTPLLYNNYKLTSILTRLGIIPKDFVIPFYSLYAVASAFFTKDYWLYLWHDAPLKVDENAQLLKAVSWLKASPESLFAKTSTEITDTSFLSSTSNIFPDIKLDMICLNHVLNEAWWKGQLDAMENFPSDFSIHYIKHIIDNESDEKCTSKEWLNWVDRFKDHFRKIGCVVN